MRRISILLILFFFIKSGGILALDQAKVDGLEHVLSTTTTDTTKVIILNKLFWEYVNTDAKQKSLISFPMEDRKKVY